MVDVVDFFCGCGGTSAGLRNAGMNIRLGIDFDGDAGATFQNNFPESNFLRRDIRKLHTSELVKFIPREREAPLFFSACAPCQPFTKQKTTRPEDDERVSLLDELHRFIFVFRPDFIFLENVPGLQKVSDEQGPFGRFINLLRSLDYEFEYRSPKSGDYGVPQVRRRLVLIASLLGKVSIPKPTHGPHSKKGSYVSVWESIADLPTIEAGQQDDLVPNHRAAHLSPLNQRRIKATPEGGGRSDWPPELHLECHKNYNGHTDVYGRLAKNQPAAALSTRCISLSNGRFGHPTQDRAISVREAARLQTFPDDFVFQGSLNSMARQIGNAVPVKLAETFGKYFVSHFSRWPGLSTEG